MIKQFRIQVGFFLESIFHTITYNTVENGKLITKKHKIKILNHGKGKYKSTRQSRNSTF